MYIIIDIDSLYKSLIKLATTIDGMNFWCYNFFIWIAMVIIMIDKVLIENIATYKGLTTFNLKKVNFIYGSNGTGKTTLSRILRNPSAFSSASIEYTRNEELETLVYNNDFVDENFSDNSMIKGIFTLGKDSNEIVKQLDELEEEKNKYELELNKKRETLEKFQNDITNLHNRFLDLTWEFKTSIADNFLRYFKGFLRKESFFELCMSLEHTDSEAVDIDFMKDRYQKLYNAGELEKIDVLAINCNFNFEKEMGNAALLGESIKGNDSLEISNLINKLQNSNWIRDGIKFLDTSDGICPFCQNRINDKTLRDLKSLFDDSYQELINKIIELSNTYNYNTEANLTFLTNIINNYENYKTTASLEKLKDCYYMLSEAYNRNKELIKEKISNPSKAIILESVDDIVVEVLSIINEIIKDNLEYNNMVDNLKLERDKLKNQVRDYLFDKTDKLRKEYKKSLKNLSDAEKNISKLIDNLENDIRNINNKMSKLRASMSGITNTIQEMNNILMKFGFDEFSFKEKEDNSTYEIVRKDGSAVKQTLSEGEQRFISFLYFYQLVKGTQNEDGIKNDRIIVIDDPISSLDSNILFIVSTLVKNLINDVHQNKGGLKQIIMLTHNVYYLKEITYLAAKPKKGISSNISYIVIKKTNNQSNVIEYTENPIKTTYDLLWEDLRNPEACRNKSTIFNTMRRILEYYFNILGGLNYEKLINEFEGEDKQICHSLLSCVNDNSHYITDDFMVILTDELIDKYIEVFKLIFEKSGQINHYNMMMKVSD